MPSRNAPRTAPPMLPMPPSTAAVNALRPAMKPMKKLTWPRYMPAMTPPTPARAERRSAHRRNHEDDGRRERDGLAGELVRNPLAGGHIHERVPAEGAEGEKDDGGEQQGRPGVESERECDRAETRDAPGLDEGAHAPAAASAVGAASPDDACDPGGDVDEDESRPCNQGRESRGPGGRDRVSHDCLENHDVERRDEKQPPHPRRAPEPRKREGRTPVPLHGDAPGGSEDEAGGQDEERAPDECEADPAKSDERRQEERCHRSSERHRHLPDPERPAAPIDLVGAEERPGARYRNDRRPCPREKEECHERLRSGGEAGRG